METQRNIIIEISNPTEPQSKICRQNSKNQHNSNFAWWWNRILVGKGVEEEEQEIRNHKNLNFWKKEIRRHIAEFIGTFMIVFFVAGIQLNQITNPNGQTANVDKGLVAGFLLVGLIYCFGKVSGAHFNPCVTLAFFLRNAFSWIRTISYIIIQFAGAIVGASVLYAIFGNIGDLGGTAPSTLSDRNAFGIEILITFFLISVVLSTSENAQVLGPTSGIAVGFTFGAMELWAWNFTGASANPWRTIGPIIVSGHGWHLFWVYLIGPIVGTILAVIIQRIMVTGNPREDTKETGQGDGKVGATDTKKEDENENEKEKDK